MAHNGRVHSAKGECALYSPSFLVIQFSETQRTRGRKKGRCPSGLWPFLLALSCWSGRYHREQLTATASAPGASLLGGPPLLPAGYPLLGGSLLLAGSPPLVRRNLCPALLRLSRCSG